MATTDITKIFVTNSQLAGARENSYLNEKYADVFFLCNDNNATERRIPAHRPILASSSKKFDSLFDEMCTEEKEIKIVDATFDVFKQFIQFFYLTEVLISISNVSDVIKLAEKYDIAEKYAVYDACEQSLIEQSTIKDICTVLDLAITFNRSKLKSHCIQQINQKTSAVLSSKSFLRCSRQTLKCILETAGINSIASMVFDACIVWATYACERDEIDSSVENCRKQLGELLYRIPFDRMQTQDVADFIEKHKGFFNRDELEELSSAMKSKQLPLKIFQSSQHEAWSDEATLECRLHTNFSLGQSIFQRMLKLSFQVNRRVMLGAISTVQLFDNCPWGCNHSFIANVLVFEVLSDQTQNVLSQQSSRFFVNCDERQQRLNFTKLTESIPLDSSKDYSIVINVLQNFFQYKYSRSSATHAEINFYEGYQINITQDDGFVACLYFNP